MPNLTRGWLRVGSGLIMASALAACAGSTSSVPPASAGVPSVTPSTAPSVAATDDPPATATPGASVTVPSLGAGTALVDVLPKSIGGEATQTLSFVGSDLSSLDPSAAMIFDGLIGIIGKPGSDMTIGVATNAKSSVIAIRVAGTSAQAISDAMVATRTLNATTTKEEVELGGKQVLKVTTTIAPFPFYVYTTGDVSFTVAAADETIAAEALSKLP
jgi:hypothetical protein